MEGGKAGLEEDAGADGGSRLFLPFKAVGLVAGDVAPVVHRLGEEEFLVVPIGNAYHLYKTSAKLLNILASPLLSADITALACHREFVFAATEDALLHVVHRVHVVASLPCPPDLGAISHLLLLGDVLVATHVGGAVAAYSVPGLERLLHKAKASRAPGTAKEAAEAADAGAEREEEVTSLETVTLSAIDLALPPRVVPTGLTHPPTYLNKVLVTASNGTFHIVNLRSEKVVFASPDITREEASAATGRGVWSGLGDAAADEDDEEEASQVPITAVEPSPAVDVVAFGLRDGRVLLHNVRLNRRVLSFEHSVAEEGRGLRAAVTALTFLAAGSLPMGSASGGAAEAPDAPALVSGTSRGALAVWDLGRRALHWSKARAHGAATVLGLARTQPSGFVSVGADNAIVQWEDTGQGMPAPLRRRTGHATPPALVRFLHGAVAGGAPAADAASAELLSCGGADGALRLQQPHLERQSREFSQGGVERKAQLLGVDAAALRLPPIVALAACDRRSGQADTVHDVLTVHQDSDLVSMWDSRRGCRNDTVLRVPQAASGSALDRKPIATAVALDLTGEWAFVGGSNGVLAVFSAESGAARGTIPRSAQTTRAMATRGERAPQRGAGGSVLPRADADVGKGYASVSAASRAADSIETAVAAVFGRKRQTSAPAVDKDAGPKAKPVVVLRDRPVRSLETAHHGAITGLTTDLLGRQVISAGMDGHVIAWGFRSRTPVWDVDLGSPVDRLRAHLESNLAAVSLSSGEIAVLDLSDGRMVRRFRTRGLRTADLCFRPDGRWLLAALADGTVQAWDLVTAAPLDWVRFVEPVTSLDFCPTSEFLATTHRGRRGVFLWASKAHFSTLLPGRPPRNPIPLALPRPVAPTTSATTTAKVEGAEVAVSAPPAKRSRGAATSGPSGTRGRRTEGGGGEGEGEEEEEEDVLAALAAFPAGADVEDDGEGDGHWLLRTSGVPASQWETLPHLDDIRRRNKPVEPAKEPERAPFFLSSLSGLAPVPDAPSGGGVAAEMARAMGFFGGAPGALLEGEEETTRKTESARREASRSFLDAPRSELGRLCDVLYTSLPAEALLVDIPDDEGLLRVEGAATDGDDAWDAAVRLVTGAITSKSALETRLAARKGAGHALTDPVAALRAVREHVKTLTPSRMDADLQTLVRDVHDTAGKSRLHAFVVYLLWGLTQDRSSTDLTQAHLALTLRVHPDVLCAMPEAQPLLALLRHAQLASQRRLHSLLLHTSCVTKHAANIAV